MRHQLHNICKNKTENKNKELPVVVMLVDCPKPYMKKGRLGISTLLKALWRSFRVFLVFGVQSLLHGTDASGLV